MAIFETVGDHFGFCSWWDVEGSEQVPPSPLGWYFD